MNYMQKVSRYLEKGSYPLKHGYQVVRILKQVTKDTNILTAGLLHDVLEDTDISYNELRNNTTPTIALLVWEVTKTGPNEFKNLHSKEAIMIKFADRLSNISNLPFPKPKEIGEREYLNKSVFWKTSKAKNEQ